jgi:misacylated tRNA(Ala) deacylase
LTELLYQTDSYLKEFTARVIEVKPDQRGVILDRTAFYPGGGGQPHDTGTLAFGGETYPVPKMEKGYVHVIEGGVFLQVGDEVRGVIDWTRRYRLMRTHTAMHIFCGIAYHGYGVPVTGNNMEPLQGRIDLEFERLQKDLVSEIEAKINAEVTAARDLRVNFIPREEAFKNLDLIRTKSNLVPDGLTQVRTVEIVGLDLQTDGGTHVANTREVGLIRITDYKSKGGINKRIYFELDE